jgi:hypothetical protein
VSTKRRHTGSGSPRVLRRAPDGELFDVKERRVVSISELREDVRAGRRFRAESREGGADCTYAVLRCVVTGGTANPQDGEPPDALSSLVRGALRNVRDWAADDFDDAGGALREGGTSRPRRPRAGRRRDSSSTGLS